MGKLSALKRFAQQQLNSVEIELPEFTWDVRDDPVKINAIFAEKDWQLDTPAVQLESNQDVLHWFACDPSTGNHLEIYFERLIGKVALVWINLHVDGRQFVLPEAYYTDNSEGHVYNAGGVRLECTAPMRKWRLTINALMKDSNEPKNQSEVHVRLGARVAMTGHTFELPKQVRPSFLARRFLSKTDVETAKANIAQSCERCQVILQPNVVYTEVALDGKKQEFLLFGSKMKLFGFRQLLQDVPVYVGYAENGTTYTAIAVGGKAYGYCSSPVHHVKPIRKGRWGHVEQQPHLPETLSMQVAGTAYEISFTTVSPIQVGVSNPLESEPWTVRKAEGELRVNNDCHKMQCTMFKLRASYEIPETTLQSCRLLWFPVISVPNLILRISEPECKNAKLTGGKGSSLAVLAAISEHSPSFTVPNAIVLTVHAYNLFAELAEVRTAIETFLQESKTIDLSELKQASEKCVSTVSKSKLPEKICHQLTDKLCESFGENWQTKKFAIRSSAVGEDTEEMSAAGQMTTYLSVKGKQQIFDAVVKCWASQFTLTAVNYKRQFGQLLNGAMAVVVQEMVSADCSGVMFTCDPLRSNPSRIFITANFGLGESVVSATADPDTYTLERNQEGNVTLVSKTCGEKKHMIIESMFEEGTEDKITPEHTAQTLCLTDEMAITIASIGVRVSSVTHSPRDIEWSIVRDKIFLLQSRPVTSFLRESDFELRHDLNTCLYTNREILSRANLDEVMPGAFSPLGFEVLCNLVFEDFSEPEQKALRSTETERSQFVSSDWLCFSKRAFMNFSNKSFAGSKEFIKSASVTMFGHDISKHEAFENGRFQQSGTSFNWKGLKFIFNASQNVKQIVTAAQSEADRLRIELPNDGDALTLLLKTLSQVKKLCKILSSLFICSMLSSFFNVLTLNVMKSSQGEEKNTPEIMVLFSKLLRSDYEVESAYIPEELTKLCNLLLEDPNAQCFLQMNLEDALKWLESDQGVAAELFRTLKAKHAHRCYKEFDIYSQTWDLNPDMLVQTLQSNARSGKQATQRSDKDSITVDELPKQPSFIQRIALKTLIPRAQFAIYAREATKSALVKAVHQVRLAIRRIAGQLVAEGRIPDSDLTFFLTIDEIYRLISTRDPCLLPRAIRRRAMHPVLNQERFPVLLYGMPKPIDPQSAKIDPNTQSMTGTPVSEGFVVGPACVIHDFSTEAHLIKKGDILITRATDTGWTPYFPLLGGVVTETGGLLSHGAVVAREYGLPAIVGIVGVTDFVNTGDMVTLDGNNGVIHKSISGQDE